MSYLKFISNDFIKSPFAKKLPSEIIFDEEFAYTYGLWKADRCSTAKGIVGLRNKDERLLQTFENFLNKLGTKYIEEMCFQGLLQQRLEKFILAACH